MSMCGCTGGTFHPYPTHREVLQCGLQRGKRKNRPCSAMFWLVDDSHKATLSNDGRSHKGGVPCAVHALCEKLAVLHHREFGKFRRLKGRH